MLADVERGPDGVGIHLDSGGIERRALWHYLAVEVQMLNK